MNVFFLNLCLSDPERNDSPVDVKVLRLHLHDSQSLFKKQAAALQVSAPTHLTLICKHLSANFKKVKLRNQIDE